MHRAFDIAAVKILRIARQYAPDLRRLCATGKNGYTVPALLSVPYDTVAGIADLGFGKILLRGLEFLQAHNVRRVLGKEAHEIGKARTDAVDVVGHYSHRRVGAPQLTP